MKTRFLCILLVATTAFSYAQRRSPFDSWDRNGDGKLIRSELPGPLQRNFERVDSDGDGFISREEDSRFRSRNGKGSVAGRLPDNVKKLADLDYAGNGNPRQKLDLYLPEKPQGEGPLPLVCWIHGGGWRNGDRANAGRVTRLVSSGKFAAASIGYRLTDESEWPGQIHDCKAAIRFLRANAETHSLDPDRIAVWGSSAGGHLVAMLGVTGNVDHLEGDIGPHAEVSSKVTCVVDYFGPTELLKMNEQGSTMDHDGADSPEGRLVGGAIQENADKARDASPIHHVTPDDEPFLIVHGTEDGLVPFQQSVDFREALEKAGVEATLITVEGGGHGRGLPPVVEQRVQQFLDYHLLGEGASPIDETLNSIRQ